MFLGVAIWGGLVLAWAFEPLPAGSSQLLSEGSEPINAAGMWQADSGFIEGRARRENQANKVSAEQVSEYKWGELLNHLTVPASFDSRTQWKGCVHPILNAGECELCGWAISAADVLSDRFCIQSSQQAVLSSQYVIDCQTDANGSDGGTAAQAWAYLSSIGTPLATCVPFTGLTHACPADCTNSTPSTLFGAETVNTYTGIQSMQAAIMQGGPIQACFQMYQEFQKYRGSIYIYSPTSSGALVRTECVKLIGWGSSNGTNYWIGAGSYGTSWGMGGYFYFKMGQTALGLETSGIAGDPFW